MHILPYLGASQFLKYDVGILGTVLHALNSRRVPAVPPAGAHSAERKPGGGVCAAQPTAPSRAHSVATVFLLSLDATIMNLELHHELKKKTANERGDSVPFFTFFFCSP